MFIPLLFTAVRRPKRLSVLVALFFLAACAAPTASEQDKNWTDLNDLVKTSDRIIVGRFVESRLEAVQLIDSDTGAIAGDTEVLFRQFEVVESLKGSSDRDDLLWITFQPGRAGELVDGRGAVQEFEAGPTYLLFLKGRLRPLEYPAEFGAVLWTGNGEPSFAEVLGNRILFWAERRYLSLVQSEDRTLPDSLSAAPFAVTLADVRAETN